MVVPAVPLRNALSELFEDHHESAVVYGDVDGETVLHQGAVTIRANGWVELPSGRLLSPEAIHHVDTYPEG